VGLASTIPLRTIAPEALSPPSKAEPLADDVELPVQLVGPPAGALGRIDALQGPAEALQLGLRRPPGAAVTLDVARRLAHEPSHAPALASSPGRDPFQRFAEPSVALARLGQPRSGAAQVVAQLGHPLALCRADPPRDSARLLPGGGQLAGAGKELLGGRARGVLARPLDRCRTLGRIDVVESEALLLRGDQACARACPMPSGSWWETNTCRSDRWREAAT
jgi:hypothetical protein